jgi:hypothetical protein
MSMEAAGVLVWDWAGSERNLFLFRIPGFAGPREPVCPRRNQPYEANRYDDFCGRPRVATVGSRYWSGFIDVETTRDSDCLRSRLPAAAGFNRASLSRCALSPWAA